RIVPLDPSLGCCGRETERRVVLVQHARLGLPDVNMVLSQLEKLLDIFLPYDMALLKRCLLHLAGDDARDVVTEDTSHSLLDGNLSHWGPSFLVVDGLLPD